MNINKSGNNCKLFIKIFVLKFLFLINISSQASCITAENIQASTDMFTCKKGEKNNLDKMILTLHRKGKLGIEDIADAEKQLYK
jgi:hypothetical protein